MAIISRNRMHNTCRDNALKGIQSILFLAILLISTSLIHAAEGKFKPEKINTVLATNDGWLIPITYYQAKLKEKAPVLIFLHGKNGNRLNWDDFIAPKFNEFGYTVITVDLRKHGKSKPVGSDPDSRSNQTIKNIDYKLMIAEDLEAVKQFIFIEHQQKNLNMRKIAIIASDMSTPLALVFTYRDWLKLPYDDGPTLESSTPRGQDVRALILISPETSKPGINASSILKEIKDPNKNIAVLSVVGTKDKVDKGQAEKIYNKLDGKKGKRRSGRFQLRTYETKYRGYNLVQNKYKILDEIYYFLEEHLKPINDPWRDREDNYSK